MPVSLHELRQREIEEVEKEASIDWDHELAVEVSEILKREGITDINKVSRYRCDRIGYCIMVKTKKILETVDLIKKDPTKYGF